MKTEDDRSTVNRRFYLANRWIFLASAGLRGYEYATISIREQAAVEKALRILGWTPEERAMFADGAPRGALGRKIRTAMKDPGFAAEDTAAPAKEYSPEELDTLRQNPVLAPEDFVVTSGAEPESWPPVFDPGTLAKVVHAGEGLWTRVLHDDGDLILAAMANDHTSGKPAFDDPVLFRRENVRNVMRPAPAGPRELPLHSLSHQQDGP